MPMSLFAARADGAATESNTGTEPRTIILDESVLLPLLLAVSDATTNLPRVLFQIWR
ncbi:hypothetical protein LMG33818_001663 [Halomonadaceae bacterium LMG 33818]